MTTVVFLLVAWAVLNGIVLAVLGAGMLSDRGRPRRSGGSTTSPSLREFRVRRTDG